MEQIIRCPCCNSEIKIIIRGSKVEISHMDIELSSEEAKQVLKERKIDLG
jgi:Zn finger protein HypA/HybF involved in hydrogenase expression